MRGNKLIPNCKTMSLFLTDGLIKNIYVYGYITWNHRWVKGTFVDEVSLQGESEFEEDDRDVSLPQSISWQHRC